MPSVSRPINPDTVEYPEGDQHQLKLSVSQISESHASVKVPYRAYVEYFNVDQVLESAAITSNENTTFGLYAYQLTLPGASGTVGFSLPGANGAVSQSGTDAEKKKKASGCNGGSIELYVDKMPVETAERLTLKAAGGKGVVAEQGASTLGATGDGGDGGSVKVVYGCVPVYGNDRDIASAVKMAVKIAGRLQTQTANWPSDFTSKEIPEILKLVQSKAVMARFTKIAASLNSEQAISKCTRGQIEKIVSTILVTLTKVDWFTESGELLAHLDDKTWPRDFGTDVDDFLDILALPQVKARQKEIISSENRTRDKVLALSKANFKGCLDKLATILGKDQDESHGALVSKLNEILLDLKGRDWPHDFKDDVDVFFKILDSPELIPWRSEVATTAVKRAEDLVKRPFMIYRTYILNLVEILEGKPSQVAGSIRKGTIVSGGDSGISSDGADRGSQVHHGRAGTCDLRWIRGAIGNESDVCFAHPYQCQMLLDQAQFLFSLGSVESITHSLDILKRLQRRLDPFSNAFVADESHSSEPKLWKAYRDNAESIFTIEDKQAGDSALYEEPHAIQQLRSIRTEAATLEQQIYSGKNFYGKDPNEVPRCTFTFYSDYMDKVLSQLKNLEDTLTNYLNFDADAAKALVNTLQKRQQICSSMQINKGLHEEARMNVEELGKKIKTATRLIKDAKATLLGKLKATEEDIKKNFSVRGEDIINSISSVVMAASMGKWAGVATLGLEAARLWSQGVGKIRSDETGSLVDKTFLIEQLRDVEGAADGKTGIKNLNEAYKVISSNGTLTLSDPGGKKLLMLESDFRKALSAFRSVLGHDYKDALAAFDHFQTIIEQRNSDVLAYNCAVVLLFKYVQKQDQLNRTLKQVNNKEYDQVSALHPAMRAFLQKRYKDDVNTTLFWLYNMQQAYRYQGLVEHYNKIGEVLEKAPTAFPNHTMLLEIKKLLMDDNTILTTRVGQPNQSKKKVPYHLDSKTIRDMTSIYSNGMRIDVRVDRNNVPQGTYDMRLDAVRFYAEGAKTSNEDGELVVKLTHPGEETFVKRDNESITFTHQPLTVLFSYKTKVKGKDGQHPITSDGNIGLDDKKDNPWARVGPLTRWRVEITAELNKGLDLSEVKQAYLEFDISYRAQT